MTTLSVIIPAYNEEDGIQAIMERVLSIRPALSELGVHELELIVVDDGSKDRTPELVLAQQDVRLIRHVKNGGYGAALKTGFAAAHGEWIGFLDADGTAPWLGAGCVHGHGFSPCLRDARAMPQWEASVSQGCGDVLAC